MSTDAALVSEGGKNPGPPAPAVVKAVQNATSEATSTADQAAGGAPGTARVTQSTADGMLSLPHVRVSASTLEIIWRCALLGSAALYGTGLVIANFNSQLYGLRTLGLVEAQYVLTGGLWLTLTALVYAVMRSAVRWAKAHGPWRGRSLKQSAAHALWVLAGWVGLLGVYSLVINFLGIRVGSLDSAIILGILMMTSLALIALVQETWQDMKERSQPDDSFLVKFRKADSIQIAKRVLWFLTALSLYATYAYPRLTPALGGGKPRQAEIIIREDRRSLFDGLAGFKVDKAGRLAPVSVVAETDQSFIVAAPEKTRWGLLPRRSLLLKKELVELVVYFGEEH